MSDLTTFDFTNQGRRPSAAQIVARWKDARRPDGFTVEYGETYANFQRVRERAVASIWGEARPVQWHDSGNGCRGVDRNAVVKLLEAQS